MPEIAMRHKLLKVEVKEVGERVLEFAGSTEDVDRMGDIIRADGWVLKQFKKNPVFMWIHDYSQPPIGRGLKVWMDKETKKLMFRIEYASAEIYEFADTIYKLYKGGFLHAVSVGFIPLEWEGKSEENPSPKWEGNIFTKQELLELSAVPVPANANALIVSARDQGLITVKEFEAVMAPESIEIKEMRNDPQVIATIKESIEAIKEGKVKPLNQVKQELGIENTTPEAMPEPRAISQEALADDIDFVKVAIREVGISEEQMPAAMELASEIIQRTTGNDMPEDITSKVGAVLNAKNKGRLAQIQELAQSVLDSAQTDDSEKQLEPDEPEEPDPAEVKRQRALEVAGLVEAVIAKLKGKRIY